MKRSPAKKLVAIERLEPQPACVGTIARVDADGRVWVEFAGGPRGATKALLASSALPHLTGRTLVGQCVLLNFDAGNPRAPIIVSALVEALPPTREVEEVHGRRVRLIAEETLELTCGNSSLHMDAQGRLVIKAENVVSRGIRSNKLKGGVVSIN
jgi:hypothetical protein